MSGINSSDSAVTQTKYTDISLRRTIIWLLFSVQADVHALEAGRALVRWPLSWNHEEVVTGRGHTSPFPGVVIVLQSLIM